MRVLAFKFINTIYCRIGIYTETNSVNTVSNVQLWMMMINESLEKGGCDYHDAFYLHEYLDYSLSQQLLWKQ